MIRAAAAITAVLFTSAEAAPAKRINDVAIACTPGGDLKSITTARGTADWDPRSPLSAAIRRMLPHRKERITLTGGMETPYRCIGGFVYALQRAGYHRIEFVSEPPSADR